MGCGSSTSLPENDFLGEKGYQITKKLADYYAVDVYLANYKGKQVAIKECTIDGEKSKVTKIFRTYKEMMSKKFENVINYHDVFQNGNTIYIVMDYCENLDLLSYLKNHKFSSEEERLEFIWRTIIFLTVGLDELHDKGIIYKDIRPRNVLFTSDLYPKFGAPDLIGDIDDDEALCFQGFTLSPLALPYVSRDLFLDGEFTKKSDVWALGATFYYLVTGVYLFNTDSIEIISKGIYDEKPLEKVDEDLRHIVKFLLQLDPDKRPYTDDILEDEVFRKYVKKYGYEEKLKPFLEGPVNKIEVINISEENYPVPAKEDEGVYRICIVGTADLHGCAFPVTRKNEKTGEEYDEGGVTYISKYMEILRNEWGDKMVYLDAGDTYLGGLESKISDGEIMIDWYNHAKCDVLTFGNHEFDLGLDFIDQYMKKINGKFLSSNIYKKNPDEPFTKDSSLILEVGKVKLGIIALTTDATLSCACADFSNIVFKNYKEVILKESAKLRPQVNAIVLLCHLGIECVSPPIQQDTYGIFDADFDDCARETGDLKTILDDLPPNTVDVVVAGHLHKNYHYFYKDTPIILPQRNSNFFNVVYLTFDSNLKLMPLSTKIEGAIPVTNKIYYGKKQAQTDRKEKLCKINYHGVQIDKDEKLEKIFEKYQEKWKEYSEKILTVDQITNVPKQSRETVMGDIGCDILREQTNSDFAIMSNGTFRGIWKPGDVTKGMTIEMFPFQNTAISFKITGELFHRLMNAIINGRKYQISGFRYEFTREVKDKKDVLKVLRIFDEATGKEIEKDKVYSCATYDFLVPKFKDDFAKVHEFYDPKESDITSCGDLYTLLFDGLKKLGKINYDEYRQRVPERVIVV